MLLLDEAGLLFDGTFVNVFRVVGWRLLDRG
jgi:hypothetical protein